MVITVVEAGVIASVAVSVIALLIALYGLARIRAQTKDSEKIYQRMLRDISIANSGSVGMGQRLLAMEKRLQTAAQTQQPVDEAADDEFESYTQAAQLFKMGLGSEEVAKRCGLSRAEASLMEMMQKASR